ncbi:pyridoxamine 5'-phosphate oxidase [Altererythrobacter aurantiacus]|uniref:Pyridoxine/pyridoxamine 5'-phosphate oxidase n=1 Tax=Parapontixanthobacter aurantiacus TaxID=1463599 RepID=A0A844ZHQ2_9SPHN|nr:pyridoxamine 5'-phosphate oxidase [Parapontixanthobacter aurantiacus]MXO86772.1 pyridoxamine 5'-phosphate oxidase [Parapontixanthobacter aurantiacus]
MKAEESVIPTGDPFGLFDAWLDEAKVSEPNDPNAMALATATSGGLPSVRMVLLKGHGPNEGPKGGFVFYTNEESRKGEEVLANPHAALLFHWKSLRRQIRIEGPLEKVSDEQADAYFASRSRQSQLGAVASAQSRPMASRSEFVERYDAAERRFAGGEVERPSYWNGFRVTPLAMEFWIDRPGRLHDRRRFTRTDGSASWQSSLLFP